MLKPKDSCRRFRDRFEPGRRDAHREGCRECSDFADLLESTATAEDRRPLPEALRQRLRGIPHHDVTCRDIDRLYRGTLSRARSGGEHDSAVDRHLASCEHCGALYGTLSSAFAVERRPLPVRLARRLSSIAGERLPVWVSDGRYAAAACYLLAALALSVPGDSAALLRNATDSVNSKARVWAQASEARGVETWDALRSTLGEGVDAGWSTVAEVRTTCEELYFDAVDAFEVKKDQLISDHSRSVEGENDG